MSSEIVDAGLGPIDLGETENVETNTTTSSAAAPRKENTFYDERSMNRDNTVSHENLQDQDRDSQNPMENVIPFDKLKNGANNAMQFLNWGIESLKEQAEKVQETESFAKMEEAVQSVRERANSALSATKPKLEELGNTVAEKANTAYNAAKPTLDEFGENARKTLDSAREQVARTTEACRPTVQKAAESANQGLSSAFQETKNAINRMTKE